MLYFSVSPNAARSGGDEVGWDYCFVVSLDIDVDEVDDDSADVLFSPDFYTVGESIATGRTVDNTGYYYYYYYRSDKIHSSLSPKLDLRAVRVIIFIIGRLNDFDCTA